LPPLTIRSNLARDGGHARMRRTARPAPRTNSKRKPMHNSSHVYMVFSKDLWALSLAKGPPP
jgi:hypothetical protein